MEQPRRAPEDRLITGSSSADPFADQYDVAHCFGQPGRPELGAPLPPLSAVEQDAGGHRRRRAVELPATLQLEPVHQQQSAGFILARPAGQPAGAAVAELAPGRSLV